MTGSLLALEPETGRESEVRSRNGVATGSSALKCLGTTTRLKQFGHSTVHSPLDTSSSMLQLSQVNDSVVSTISISRRRDKCRPMKPFGIPRERLDQFLFENIRRSVAIVMMRPDSHNIQALPQVTSWG